MGERLPPYNRLRRFCDRISYNVLLWILEKELCHSEFCVIFHTDYGLDERSSNPKKDRDFSLCTTETDSWSSEFHIQWMTIRQSEMGRLCSTHELNEK
jgi:hypothetical protein